MFSHLIGVSAYEPRLIMQAVEFLVINRPRLGMSMRAGIYWAYTMLGFCLRQNPIASRAFCLALSILTFGLLASGSLTPSRTAHAQPVRLGGTGAGLGTMHLLGAALAKAEPQFSLEIVPNLGSSGGLKALARNAVQLAVISRALKPEEAAQGFTAIEYGKTPFVLVTTRRDLGNLTLAQIADIYSGKRESWADGTPIRLVLRPANDSDTAVLAAFSPAIKTALASAQAREGMVVGITDQDSANELQRLKGGLGTASLALVLSEKRPLSVIPIEGVTPSVTTLTNKTYPYFKPMYFVTRSNAPAAVTRFIEFTRSAQGQRILADTGHWVENATHGAKPAPR
jgi:phosphate transport system substrate-binding protein